MYPPREYLLSADTRPFIVITTVNYQSVIDEIETLDLVCGEDFCVTPLLNERKKKDELKALDKLVLVSSPEHAQSNCTGGGLYLLSTLEHSVKKIVSGKGRGLTRLDEGYAWVDMLKGIVFLDDNFNETDVMELAPNSEAHGIYYYEQEDSLLVAQPGRDSIAVYDKSTRAQIKEIFVSTKWSKNKKDNHHLNDMCVYAGSIFQSMFSFSGNWPNEVYDGGVMEIDFESGEIIGPVIDGMWMPHSVSRVGGKLTCVDSMRGTIIQSSYRTLGKFPGFVRGMDYDGKFFFVGVSEHRYPEKLYGDSLNIGLDAGVIVFDDNTKMSRFIAMPQITSIHALITI